MKVVDPNVLEVMFVVVTVIVSFSVIVLIKELDKIVV